MNHDFDFTDGGYVPAAPFNFYFGPLIEDLGIHVLAGTTNFFTSVWAYNGTMYVASSAALSVVDTTYQTLTDYYTPTHSGSRGEALDHNDVVDINITGG